MIERPQWSDWTDEALIEYEERLYDQGVEGDDTWAERDEVLWEINRRPIPHTERSIYGGTEMHNVMVKPEPAPEATETAVVTKYYYYHDAERKKAARESLRRTAEGYLFRSEDGMADVALEQIWNILLGNN